LDLPASVVDDPRFAANAARIVHRDELIAKLDEVFAGRGRAMVGTSDGRRRAGLTHQLPR
jgi:crotonobetainyl-CoA:carnitine CoA-transferase CaiB-like acyl-CoA transferase